MKLKNIKVGDWVLLKTPGECMKSRHFWHSLVSEEGQLLAIRFYDLSEIRFTAADGELDVDMKEAFEDIVLVKSIDGATVEIEFWWSTESRRVSRHALRKFK